MNSYTSRILTPAILIVGLCFGVVTSGAAQNTGGDLGIGGQIGEPSGITLKSYDPGGMSYDFLAAFDLDDFFYLNAHGTFERPVSDDGQLNVFYGPGGFVGIYDRPTDSDDELALGISGRLGLNVYIEQFEIYVQVTPRIEVVPATDGDIGGGLGFRYYF